nr:MAG TPA: hypothetical protein [Caudoviricetes sp.]
MANTTQKNLNKKSERKLLEEKGQTLKEQS